jgi:hypothetical protein
MYISRFRNRAKFLIPIIKHVPFILSLSYLLLVAIYFLFTAFSYALNVDTYAANGTFQLYNPLQRLADGELAGHDFPFFHGIAIPIIHYPFFVFMGSGVMGAEFSKWFVSSFLFLVVTVIFFRAYFKSWKRTTVASAVFSAIALPYIDVVYPGNSLLGLRSATPVLVAAAMILIPTVKRIAVSKNFSISVRNLAVALLLGFSVVMGTEQGAAACAAYMLLYAWQQGIFTKQNFFAALKKSTLRSLGIFAAILGFTTLFSGGHPVETLTYALRDVPADQAWYFGTHPNPYLTWSNLIPGLIDTRFMLYILIGSATFAPLAILAKKYQLFSRKESTAATFLVLATIIVFVSGAFGYYAPGTQLIPFLRIITMLSVIIVLRLLYLYLGSQKKQNPANRRYLATTLLAGIVGGTMFSYLLHSAYSTYKLVDVMELKSILTNARIARKEDDYYAASLRWKTSMDTLSPSINKSATTWSTYRGLYESQWGIHSPMPGGEDYIIHALGKQRRETYEKTFNTTQPGQVITLSAMYFPYEEWLWTRHWPIYRTLFTEYDIAAENPSHILWKRRAGANTQQPEWTTLQLAENYPLPANNTNQPQLYEVSIDYAASSGLPANIMSKVPRYIIDINGSKGLRNHISLPSYEKEWLFPVIIMPGENSVNLTAKADGIIPTAKLSIAGVKYRELPITQTNKYLLIQNYCLGEKRFESVDQCKPDVLKLSSYK